MSWIVGCDTGGTFTDVVALSDTGEFRIAKVPLDSAPLRSRRAGRGASARHRGGRDLAAVPRNDRDDERGDHQARGRKRLITTKGFRDILEIRRTNRQELYDILWDPPAPLIPRRHRLEVSERVDYAGNVVVELDDASVRDAARKIRARGLESVAVCLINAHMNPAHEERIRDVLLEELPDVNVSLSTEILPEPPEFVRTATTVANAYTAPVLSSYMERLGRSLGEHGLPRTSSWSCTTAAAR